MLAELSESMRLIEALQPRFRRARQTIQAVERLGGMLTFAKVHHGTQGGLREFRRSIGEQWWLSWPKLARIKLKSTLERSSSSGELFQPRLDASVHSRC
jgi:hypothetical protein